MVHGAVAALRRALEPGAPHVLVTRDGGYVLEVPAEWVDAARFERALKAGRRLLARSPQRASSLLTEALAEWRGPAALCVLWFVPRDIPRRPSSMDVWKPSCSAKST